MTSGSASLGEVLITVELERRLPHPPDVEVENRAFRSLTHALVENPESLLTRLVELARELCRADTAGISLLEPAEGPAEGFRWIAVSGSLDQHLGIMLPADFSPCGVCLKTGAAQLFDRPGRHFGYLEEAAPGVGEALVIPFRVGGRMVGTVWILARDASTHYTSTEASVMRALADFTAAAFSALEETKRSGALAASELEARQRAEAATRVTEQFLSTVSHELRAPLNSILGWSELLDQPDVSAGERRMAIDAIHRNAERQARIVDDLIDTAQSAAGALHCDSVPTDLSALVSLAVDDLDRTAAEAGVTLRWRGPYGPMPLVAGDPVRLQQVFANLIANAIRHSSSGGTVTVRLEVAADTVSVRVIDTGEGIEPRFLPRVFDRFSRGDSSTRRRHSGLGLGLTIARDIVERHGGAIEAASEGLGCGATLTVTLPVVTRTADRSDAVREPDIPRLDGVRVLVVDDDADAREVVAATLRRYGADTATADGTPSALLSLSAEPFDVLLADIAMPGSDGFDLLERVGRLGTVARRRLRVAALTASCGPEACQRIATAGFERHLTKPISARELIGAVAALAPLLPVERDLDL